MTARDERERLALVHVLLRRRLVEHAVERELAPAHADALRVGRDAQARLGALLGLRLGERADAHDRADRVRLGRGLG